MEHQEELVAAQRAPQPQVEVEPLLRAGATVEIDTRAPLAEVADHVVTLAEADGVGAAGVLVTGSVVLVGEARTLLVNENEPVVRPGVGDDPDDDWDADYAEDPGRTGSGRVQSENGSDRPEDDW